MLRRVRPKILACSFHRWNSTTSSTESPKKNLQDNKFIFKRLESKNTKNTGNNQVTLARAKDEYGVSEADLARLEYNLMRSPYEDGESIKVYLEEDIIRISAEKKLFQGAPNDIEKYTIRQNTRMQLVNEREKDGKSSDDTDSVRSVVYWQFGGNFTIFTMKTIFAIQSGSASMFSEAVHSFVDTLNSVVLFYGVHSSQKSPSVEHPYGYENMRYITSLVSGVGIFCLGAGVSFWHGVQCALIPHALAGDFTMAYFTLFGSAVIDGIVLMKALATVNDKAVVANMSLYDYIKQGSDPSVNVVLMEDSCAVAGCGVAALCMYLTQVTNNHYFDAGGSMIIGGMLGGVATFLMVNNARYLIGKSIPQDVAIDIQDHLEEHSSIKGVYDMKATYIGPDIVRMKAEIDIDGSVIASQYLDSLPKAELSEQIEWIVQQETLEQRSKTTKQFLVHHISGGVDHVGKEIDNIEFSTKGKFPQIKHVDLEIL